MAATAGQPMKKLRHMVKTPMMISSDGFFLKAFRSACSTTAVETNCNCNNLSASFAGRDLIRFIPSTINIFVLKGNRGIR